MVLFCISWSVVPCHDILFCKIKFHKYGQLRRCFQIFFGHFFGKMVVIFQHVAVSSRSLDPNIILLFFTLHIAFFCIFLHIFACAVLFHFVSNSKITLNNIKWLLCKWYGILEFHGVKCCYLLLFVVICCNLSKIVVA